MEDNSQIFAMNLKKIYCGEVGQKIKRIIKLVLFVKYHFANAKYYCYISIVFFLY